ncbi:hypothetical protein OPV22_018712 [Ensete ventricosum]|uniref:RING-type E3 ubiquitin transferase n=1 Tax=Ensete ventricosum TaxID=4639 RepID=A0AAV8QUV0_ENSVE|nr:hypothetical protein OPV22_018712 [Ensete ventricosum]
MASADGRGLRRFLFRSSSSSSSRPHAAADRNALIGPPPPPPPPPPQPRPSSPARKKGLAAAAFRGLGCASAAASQAYAPAVAAVRSSADWQGKRPRRRRAKKKKKEGRGADVWCAPGMPFAAEASVDCVMAHQPMVGRGRFDAAERIHRERPYIPRRASHQEQISSAMDSPSNLETPFYGPDLLPLGHLRHLRGYHRTPGGLEEIMMFQTRVLLRGGMVVYDQFRDWRLDVDNMSYEELLELGDRIGYVNAGLREEEIARSLRKTKHSAFDASANHFSPEVEWKCSICQEEYERNDETGRLQCGHSFHINCIKKWLLLKNACPVCKTPVLKT